VQAACGVEHIDVIAAEAGLGLGAFGDLHRALALDDRQGIDADLRAENLQLLHCGGAVGIERGHQHALALALLEALGELGGGCRLARALKADHQDRRGRVVDLEGAGILRAGQHTDQLVVDDLDDLLARRDRLGHGLAGGLGLNGVHEVTGDRQRDVSLEKRHAHLAQGGLYIIFRKSALLGQPVEDT
jgi:hypothetical protein